MKKSDGPQRDNVTRLDAHRGQPRVPPGDACLAPANPYVEGGRQREAKAMQVGVEPSNKLDDGFRVGEFDVYPKRLSIVREGVTARLEPKVMAVLVYLAERANDVVTRNEFAEHVWRGRVVSDEVLSRDISILRAQLGDDAKDPSYVLTIPRVGYRLIAKVEALTAVDDATPGAGPTSAEAAPVPLQESSAATRRFRWKWIASVAAIALIASSAIVYRHVCCTVPPLDRTHIAVLPFVSLSDKRDDEYFSDGLSEEIMNALGSINGVSVVAKTSSFAFRNPRGDAHSIGRSLDAGSLLEGSVRRDGDRLRISAQLIDANTGLQVWSESYDRRTTDIFDIQNQISETIARQLVGTLAPHAAPPAPTQDIEAYNLFLRANYLLRQRGAVQLTRAIELYKQAIARDPNFARAYVGLADTYTVQPSYTGTSELAGYRLALEAAQRAEALGEDASRLAGLRGYIAFRSRQWQAALDDFRVALAASANDSDTLQWYSQFLASVGYMARARDAAQRAVKADPLSPAANQRAGVMSLWADDAAAAARYFGIAAEVGIERNGLPEALLAFLLRERRFDDARRVLYETQKVRNQASDWIEPSLAAIAGTASERSTALDLLDRDYSAGQLSVPMYVGALVMLGDVDAFYRAMPAVVRTGEPLDIEVLFSGTAQHIRIDPRFGEFATALGLVQFWDATEWPEGCRRVDNQVVCR